MSDEKNWELSCGHAIGTQELKTLWSKYSLSKRSGTQKKPDYEGVEKAKRGKRRNLHLEVLMEYYPDILSTPNAVITPEQLDFVREEVKRRSNDNS